MNAHYYIGLARLAEGDRAGAVKHFAVVEATGGLFASPPWAKLLLKRLREDLTWPPWIPLHGSDRLTVGPTGQPPTEPDDGSSTEQND
jgi:hypothetical protein